ncbi:hypothetical protein GSI_00685 [Ganoderma sinense ZZ0214-1]|uniref:Uncharacterized protein n=1 Tax=Ganoderma sinense ZZ0214-1 TaxID=1077348 RepID=A0A2G8STF8_9APHY|nr:hypothetical protein GSI_00685 [Ganoderma sinense ZZ0214-1]
MRAEEQQKSAAKRMRPQSTVVEEVKPQIADDEDMGIPTPRSNSKAIKEMSAVPDVEPSEVLDRAISPVSTVTSGSEPPLAHRVKMNGIVHIVIIVVHVIIHVLVIIVFVGDGSHGESGIHSKLDIILNRTGGGGGMA